MSGEPEHEKDAMSDTDFTSEQHERLCAYVFGELEGAERTAFEAELAASPALQAERERIEATVGFVQANLGGDALSPEIRGALSAAASEKAAGATEPAIPAGWRFLRGGGALRLAAGFAIVFGAAFAWNVFRQGDEAARGTDEVAQLGEAKDEAASAPLVASATEAKEEASSGMGASSPTIDSPTRRELARLGKETASDDAGDAGDAARAKAAAAEPSGEPLRDLGYVEVPADERVAQNEAAGRAAGPPSQERAGDARFDPATGAYVSEDRQSGFFVGPQPGAGPSEADRDAQVAKLTDRLEALGYVEVPGVPPASPPAEGEVSTVPMTVEESTRGLGYLGSTEPSSHRGPGDTVPSGGGSNVSPGAGPARTAQTGASAPEPTGADGWYLGLGTTGKKQVETRSNEPELLPGGITTRTESVAAGPRSLVSGAQMPSGSSEAYEYVDAETHDGVHAPRRVAPIPMSEDDFVGFCGTVLDSCRIRPTETPRDMFFRCWGDNPFVVTAQDRLSTFAIDVDTASYALARNYLNRAQLPPKEAVRTEEFVNYFKADAPAPAPGATFGLGLELAPTPFDTDPNARLLRVTVRGKDVDPYERQPVALTFVIDVSGSMNEGGRLELVKRSLQLLISQLSTTDSIAIVTFNKQARLVSHMTSAANRGILQEAILNLTAGGGTNVGDGLNLGYRVAAEALTPNAVNRVVLLSDGVGNIGTTDAESILRQVRDLRAKGIYLNTLGVGMGNHDDAFLEQLADAGDGQTNYIDSDREAKRALVDDFTGAFQPIARDVKIQMTFDPSQVLQWRQLGYENRKLAHADFRNDAVDAGEVNAGHQVTALYELILDPSLAADDSDEPLVTLSVRFKPPFAVDSGREDAAATAAAEVAKEIRRDLHASDVAASFAATSAGYRRSAIVAQFAELLRRSVHARGESIDELAERAHALRPELRDADFDELVTLIEMARPLLRRELARYEQDRVGQLLDELCRLHYLEGLRDALGQPSAEELRRQEKEGAEYRASLERQIIELLRQRHLPTHEER